MLTGTNARGAAGKNGLVALRVATLNARDESASGMRASDNVSDTCDSLQQRRRSSGRGRDPSKRVVEPEVPVHVKLSSSSSAQQTGSSTEQERSEQPAPTSHLEKIDKGNEGHDKQGNCVATAKDDVGLPTGEKPAPQVTDLFLAQRQGQPDRHIDSGASGYGGGHFERIVSGTLVPIGVTSRQQADPLSPWARLFTRSHGLLEGPCSNCAANSKAVSSRRISSTKDGVKREATNGIVMRSHATNAADRERVMLASQARLSSHRQSQEVQQQQGRVHDSPTAEDIAGLISTVDEVISSHQEELRQIVEVLDPQSSFDHDDLLRHGFTSDLTYIQGLHSSGWMELIAEVEDAIRDWHGRFATPNVSSSSSRRVRFLSLDEEEQLARAKMGEHSRLWRLRRAPTGFPMGTSSVDDDGSRADEESDCSSELE